MKIPELFRHSCFCFKGQPPHSFPIPPDDLIAISASYSYFQLPLQVSGTFIRKISEGKCQQPSVESAALKRESNGPSEATILTQVSRIDRRIRTKWTDAYRTNVPENVTFTRCIMRAESTSDGLWAAAPRSCSTSGYATRPT